MLYERKFCNINGILNDIISLYSFYSVLLKLIVNHVNDDAFSDVQKK